MPGALHGAQFLHGFPRPQHQHPPCLPPLTMSVLGSHPDSQCEDAQPPGYLCWPQNRVPIPAALQVPLWAGIQPCQGCWAEHFLWGASNQLPRGTLHLLPSKSIIKFRLFLGSFPKETRLIWSQCKHTCVYYVWNSVPLHLSHSDILNSLGNFN